MTFKAINLNRYTGIIWMMIGGCLSNGAFAQSPPTTEANPYSIPAEVQRVCESYLYAWNPVVHSMMNYGCRSNGWRTYYTCPEGTRNAQNGRCLLPYRPSSYDPNEVLAKPNLPAGVIHELITPKRELLNEEFGTASNEAHGGV